MMKPSQIWIVCSNNFRYRVPNTVDQILHLWKALPTSCMRKTKQFAASRVVNCCEQTLDHPRPPRNLSYWLYLDSNDETSYTWLSEQCPPDSQFDLCDSCNFDQCQYGKGLHCTQRNFGSMGGGCAPSHKDAWDYRDTQIYTLIEIGIVK